MADEGTERFDRELERLLARDGVPARGRNADPLLNLAAELRGQLAVLPAPDPEFRARLKAELLEQYTNNVRQFPGSAMPESAPPRLLWQRWGRAALAAAAASAACIGLAAGYSQLHAHQQISGPQVAMAVQRTVTPAPSATPAGMRGVSAHALPTRMTIVLAAPSATPTARVRTLSSGPLPFSQPTRLLLSATPAVATTVATTAGLSPSATMVPTATPSATAAGSNPRLIAPGSTVAPSATSVPVPTTRTAVVPVPSATPARPAPSSAVPSATPARPAPSSAVPTASAHAATDTDTSLPSATPTAMRTAMPTPASPTAAPATHFVAAPAASATEATPPSPTPLPDATAMLPTAVPTSTPPQPSATVAVPSASPAATVSSASPAEHPRILTVARRATATPTTTFAATKTATAAGTDTPVAATAVQGTMVAANASPSSIAQSAAALAATATAVRPEDQFPAPTLKNALPDSPLAHTVPYTPAVRLNVSQVPDPGILTVCKPVTEPAGRDMLQAFNLSVVRLQSQSRTHLRAIVEAGHVTFDADYRPRDSGYALTLKRLSPVPGGLPPQAGFNAASAARIFLGAHQLTAIGSTALQADSVVTQPDGSTLVTFSEQYAPGKIVGASAAVTFQAGVLSNLAIQWVDTSVCPSAPGVPFLEALSSVLAGDGLIRTAGPLPDASARVVGTDIVYVPVSGADGTYYEPVWRISGVTGTAGATPFEVYVPAISDAYLR